MTLGDVFTGHFTWYRLAGEALPIIIPAVIMFWAGYAMGWNRGMDEAEKIIKK